MICTVVGRYNGAILNDTGTLPALLPLSLLEAIDGMAGQDLANSTARFVIDPTKNRELTVFRKAAEEAVAKPGAGLMPLAFVIWDEELRQVVAPMEKNLQLMSVLYPATILLSVLIAAGLATLLMLQSAKEAAIMRALGANKPKVRLMLCLEQALLCLVGILLGAAAPDILWGRAVHTGQTFLHMGAYLGGSLIGSILAAAAVVSRKTLELLQVKE
jgi:cell division protein FtsX